MDERKRRGDRGEALVADALSRRGFMVLERQYRSRWGEIDIIVRSPKGTLCFVEVKTRRSDGFASAAAAVTPAKQRRIRLTAQCYLAERNLDCRCRFDVAEVYPSAEYGWARPRIHFIADAF